MTDPESKETTYKVMSVERMPAQVVRPDPRNTTANQPIDRRHRRAIREARMRPLRKLSEPKD